MEDGDPTVKYECAKDVMTWLFDQPLLYRTTDKEREWAKRVYSLYNHRWKVNQNEATEGVYCAVQSILWILFGEDFFRREQH